MSLQSNLLGQTAALRCERSATFQGLFLLWNVRNMSHVDAAVCSRRSDWILSPRKLQDWCNVTAVCQSRGTAAFALNAGRTCSYYLPYESGLTIVCRGPCSLFPLPWIPWLSPAVSEWVSECVDVFVSQICRPKGGRCCTNQVASEMRSNWNAVVSELRNSKCHGACSVQNLLSLHLPPPPTKGNPAVWNMLQNIIIILRLVVCECANWVLGLREAYIWTWIYCILECDTVLPGRHADGLEKPSSSMTRVATRGEVSGGWKNLRNEELHYLSLSLNANKVMKSSSMRCTGGMQSTGELTNACTVLIAPPRPRHVCTGYVWLMIRTTGACYSNDTDQLSDYHLLKISCSACR